jgi:hypothetical protein
MSSSSSATNGLLQSVHWNRSAMLQFYHSCILR